MKPTLETDRLILRPLRIEDAEEMFYGWANDSEVTRFLAWNAHENVEETKRILNIWMKEDEKPEILKFAIVLKEENRVIGEIDACNYSEEGRGTPELSYVLSRKFWNNGYMSEACRCVIDFLFSKGFSEIRIDALPENVGSIRVIEKNGGVFQKTTEDFYPQKNKRVLLNSYIVKAK